MRVIASATDHHMSLVGIPVYGSVLWNINLRFYPVPLGGGSRDVTNSLFQQTDHPFEIHISLNEEDRVVRTVVSVGKTERILALELMQEFRFSQDVSSQRMVREDKLFKVVENQFGRSVLIALDFIDDNFHFLVYFRLRVGAVEDNVSKQFHRPWEMFHQESAVHHRFLLVGVSVQVAPYMFHTVQDVPGMPFLRSLEDEMFHKVCHPLFVFGFITGTGINGISAISHGRLVLGMNDS